MRLNVPHGGEGHAMQMIHCCVMLRNLKHRALRWRLKFAVRFSFVLVRAESRAAYSRNFLTAVAF